MNGSADRESIPTPPNEQELCQIALRALTRRDYSSSELRVKLLKASGTPSQVEALLKRLRGKGYLDDRKFAVNYIHHRKTLKMVGRTRLLNELRARGFADSLSSPLLDEFFPAEDEAQLLEKALQKKIRALSLGKAVNGDAVPDAKSISKLYNYLFRLGFSQEAIRRSLNRCFRNAADFPE